MRCFSVRAMLFLLPALAGLAVPAAAVQEAELTAPGEIVSDVTRSRRKLAVGDMVRTGLATRVEQGPRGVLRVALGPNFHSSSSRELNFRRLTLAYFEWAEENRPMVVELLDRENKVGEYSAGLFTMDPGYVAAQPVPQEAPPPGQEAPAATPAEVTPSRHAGFHIAFGLGGGSVGLSCDRCDYSRETSLSGYLSLGAAIARNVVVGVEGTGWTQNEGAQVYSLMAQATGYLSDASGLFLTAGAGLLGRREETSVGELTATGLGLSGRLGYELELGGSLLVIPYLAYLTTAGGADFEFNGAKVGEYDISNFQFGLALGIN